MWHRCKNNCAFLPSRLARALWIEGIKSKRRDFICIVEARESLVDRRMLPDLETYKALRSRLARALWIEGTHLSGTCPQFGVEARESLVDRRTSILRVYSASDVEARESLVDRRRQFFILLPQLGLSRLARALWIEGAVLPTSQAPCNCRGSREPCGSKDLAIAVQIIGEPSRLARALWIEGALYPRQKQLR